MDPIVRDDIVQELRGHLAESAAANAGNVGVALAQMGPPGQVARGYKDLYGYGVAARLAFIGVAALLAIPSVPILMPGGLGLVPYDVSAPFLVGLVAFLLWVSVRAGSTVGVLAGLSAFGTRSVALGLVIFADPGAIAFETGLAIFVATSVALIVLGWLPGTARKAWSRPGPDL